MSTPRTSDLRAELLRHTDLLAKARMRSDIEAIVIESVVVRQLIDQIRAAEMIHCSTYRSAAIRTEQLN